MTNAEHKHTSPDAHCLWTPAPGRVAASQLTRFAAAYKPGLDASTRDGYQELHRWSLDYSPQFWRAVWEFSDVIGSPGGIPAREGSGMLDWTWFPEAKLNYAQNLLRVPEGTQPEDPERVVLITHTERGERTEWTRVELTHAVLQVAGFLRSVGVRSGDRVAAVLPNHACAIVGYLATAAIGAIWSSCSPDFGPEAIRDRFSQIEPKVLITSTCTTYNGKEVRPWERVLEVLPHLPSVKTVLVESDEAETLKQAQSETQSRLSTTVAVQPWAVALQFGALDAWTWEWFPFDHPLCILYSSGTTGVPKCIVHRAGGALLQHNKEHRLHADLGPADSLLYFTTTGWMMWNWLVGALATKACIVAYDGSPVAPDMHILWRIAERESLTHLGASARYYALLDKSGIAPSRNADLGSLRCLLSTGSPLLPETFDWVYSAVKSDLHLASISGGTDILSCFVLGNPNASVYRGQIQCAGLGMDVQILHEEKPAGPSVPGELVCAHPFPCMPIGFWNDPDGSRYRASYFEKIPGVWCHGDWAELTEQGGFIIHGRSDATLNPGGVRIGTAEIYQQVEAFEEVAEALATCYKQDGDESIVLFVRMQVGKSLTEALKTAIRTKLRQNCSPRHVPACIQEAPDFPRTISGKLSEIAVRNAICGRDLGNAGALANPESLTFFRSWRLPSS